MKRANRIGVSFARQLRRATDAANDQLAEAVVNIVREVAGFVIGHSPVGDPTLWQHPAPKGYVPGGFRANWQHGTNMKPLGTLPVVDAEGVMTLARIVASARANPVGRHHLVNNLPYARALEYGHSTQAPAGIVGLAQLAFPALVAQAARRRVR